MMRIVFLHDNPPGRGFAGATVSTYDLALGILRAGHDVSVITTCRQESEAGESEYQGLRVFKIVSDYPSHWRGYVSLYNRPVVRELDEILAQIAPDIVHIQNVHFYLSYYAIKVAKRHAKGVALTFRDVMPFSFAKLTTKRYLERFDCRVTWWDQLRQARKRWNPLRNLTIRHYLKYPDKLFAVSVALKEALCQNGIENVEVLHTGASIPEWQTSREEVARFKNAHGLDNKLVVFFGGRLSGAKGSSQLLKAMSFVVQEVPNAVLVVAAHREATETERTSQQLGLGKNVIFTGWIEREEMKHAYGSADVVVVPSICFDSFPRAVLEAMASGKPVIGTCYGGAPEIISDGKTGFVVNPFEIEALAAHITDLLRDGEKRARFGEAARERVRTHFNLDEKVKEHLARYEELLK